MITHEAGGFLASLYVSGMVYTFMLGVVVVVGYIITARKVGSEEVAGLVIVGMVAGLAWPLVPPAGLVWLLRGGVQHVRAKTPSGRKLSYDELLARNAELEDQLGVGDL